MTPQSAIAAYFKEDGQPIKCPQCGSVDLKERVTDMIEHTVCETEVKCANGHYLGHWAYGSWDPSFEEDARNHIHK